MNLWFIIILVAYFGLFFSLLHFYLYALKYQYETIVGSSNTFLGHKQWLVDNIDIYVSERCEGVGEKILIRPKCFKIHLAQPQSSKWSTYWAYFGCNVPTTALWQITEKSLTSNNHPWYLSWLCDLTGRVFIWSSQMGWLNLSSSSRK